MLNHALVDATKSFGFNRLPAHPQPLSSREVTRMKKLISPVLSLICCLAAASFPGCGPEERPENVLARVGDTDISLEDFRREWVNQPPLPPGVPPDSVEKFLEDMIAEKLLLAEARRRKLDGDAEFQREVERFREGLLVQRLLEQEVLNVTAPSPEEVEEYWTVHRELFSVPELIRISHILIRFGDEVTEEEALERCREVRMRLEQGEDFAAVARDVSQSENAERGGDLGYLSEAYIEQYIPQFLPTIREVERGEVSGPLKTDYGYHLLQVTDLKPPREKTLEESREEIEVRLLAERRKARLEKIKSGIAASVPVERNRPLIQSLQAEQNQALFAPPGATSEIR